MLLPLILLIIGLITVFLFRARFSGGDAEATVNKTKRPIKIAASVKSKESLPMAASTSFVSEEKSVTLVPAKMRKEITQSMSAPPQQPTSVASFVSTNTAVARIGPTDSEARAAVENLETQTPQVEPLQLPPAQSSTSTESGQPTTTSGASSGSEDAADPTGKKKKKSKSKKIKHKKEGKDKKKKKKSQRLEPGKAPKP